MARTASAAPSRRHTSRNGTESPAMLPTAHTACSTMSRFVCASSASRRGMAPGGEQVRPATQGTRACGRELRTRAMKERHVLGTARRHVRHGPHRLELRSKNKRSWIGLVQASRRLLTCNSGSLSLASIRSSSCSTTPLPITSSMGGSLSARKSWKLRLTALLYVTKEETQQSRSKDKCVQRLTQ